MGPEQPARLTKYEVIDGPTLAARWHVPPTWIRKHTSCATDPLPQLRLGRYVRFLWGSPELNGWLERRYQK